MQNRSPLAPLTKAGKDKNQLQEFDALVEALRAGKLLQPLEKSVKAKANAEMLVVTALHQAIYSVKECNRLEGHSQGVIGVCFSQNAKAIASGSSDHTIKLWSLDGRELHTFQGHEGVVNSICFSPDGETIASGSNDNTIKLWSLDGREVQSFQEHRSSVVSISFSPDGQMLASASYDGTVILWNFNLDSLMKMGCSWVRDYLRNNPNVSDRDRHLCDCIDRSE